MRRRDFLTAVAATGAGAMLPMEASARAAPERRTLVLVELRGGNDGLNTVVPYSSAAYYRLRPTLAVPHDEVLPLDAETALHPALEPLLPLWAKGEVAIVQGVRCAETGLSHFRAIEIWNTAPASGEYLKEDWLSRALACRPMHAAARRVVDLCGVPDPSDDSVGALGPALQAAARLIATDEPPAVVRLALDGFDTHADQRDAHAALLAAFAQGLAAFRHTLRALGRWHSTLIMTTSEFGRAPQENAQRGTDHGTASVHFVLGGRVRGGLYGAPPDLSALREDGQLPHFMDFRRLYASVLERWWHMPSEVALLGPHAPIELLRA